MCEQLVVAICDDEYVRQIKHKEPIILQEDRMRLINALKCVDKTILVNFEETDNKMLLWKKINF